MGKKIEKQVSELLELTKKGVMKAVEIIKEQFPDLVKQILRWEVTQRVLFISGCLLGMVAGVVLANFGLSIKPKSPEDVMGFVQCVSILGGIIGGGISTGWIFYHLRTLLMVLITPKVYMLEYLQELRIKERYR